MKLFTAKKTKKQKEGSKLSLAPGTDEASGDSISNGKQITPQSAPGADEAYRASSSTSAHSRLVTMTGETKKQVIPTGQVRMTTTTAAITEKKNKKANDEGREEEDVEYYSDSEGAAAVKPGAVAIAGLAATDTASASEDSGGALTPTMTGDVENPVLPQQERSLIEAEVAPDLDSAIDRAVENALRRRDGNIVEAQHVAPEEEGAGAANDGEAKDLDDREKARKKKLLIYGGIGLFVMILAIVLATTLGASGDDAVANPLLGGSGNGTPSVAPTIFTQVSGPNGPTASPFTEAPSTSPLFDPTTSPNDQINTVVPTRAPIDGGSPAFTPSPAPSIAPVAPTPPPTPSIASPSDDCFNAIEITPGFSKLLSNLDSNSSFTDSTCIIQDGDKGIWLKYTPTREAVATMTVSSQNFIIKMSYYTGSCDSLICQERTTSSSAGDRSITFHAQVGMDCFIFIAGNGVNSVGVFQFDLLATEPPVNSYCSGATDVSNDVPYEVIDTTVGTVPTILNLDCDIDATDRGLWYKVAPVQETVIVTATISDQAASTQVTYFSGSCDNLVCGDNSFASNSSPRTVTLLATAGKTYYILVSGSNFEQVGSFRINIDAPSPPDNSFCSGAADVGSIFGNSFTIDGESTYAVPSYSSLACEVESTHRGLWYKFTPLEESITTARLSLQDYSARISYYTGDCSGILQCQDESGASANSDRIIEFHAKAAVDYYFLVTGLEFDSYGTYTISFESPEPPANSFCSGATRLLADGLGTEFREESAKLAIPAFSNFDCNIEATQRGLWYKFSAVTDTFVEVSVRASGGFRFRLSYYIGDCGALTCGDESATASSTRTLGFHAVAGIDYFLLVSGASFEFAGDFRLDILAPMPPVDSFCSGATAIISLDTTLEGDTTDTVPSHDSSECSIGASTRGVWYKIPATAGITDGVTATVRNQTFQLKMTLFSSSSDSCSELACVMDTSFSKFSSRELTWVMSPGTTYYVLVSGEESLMATGGFIINFAQASLE